MRINHKDNFNLEYFSKLDSVQKNLVNSYYSMLKINKVSITVVSDLLEKDLSTQMKLLFYFFTIDNYFPIIRQYLKTGNKEEESLESFVLEFTYDNEEEILHLSKCISLEFLSHNLSKNVSYSTEKNSTSIKLRMSLDRLAIFENLFFPLDLKDVDVYFHFHVNRPVTSKDELITLFPFWMND